MSDFLSQLSPWTAEYKARQNAEEQAYREYLSLPYFLIHLKPTKKQWKQQMKQAQQKQGTVKPAELTSAPVKVVNQYVRQFKHDLAEGKIPKGKYTLPAIALSAAGATGFAAAPLSFVGGATGGYLGDQFANFGTKLVTGKTWADWLNSKTGLDTEAAAMTNPGMWTGANAWVNGTKTIQRAIAQDVADGVTNQNLLRGLLRGSPNFGNVGLLDKSNPMYHWGKGRKFAAATEFGNHLIPWLPPVSKSAARWVAKNIATQSPSPERIGLTWNSFFKEGDYNGVINFAETDLKEAYPNIDFIRYYLWREDPILRWSPKVQATAKYFKENHLTLEVPVGTTFGSSKYELYGNMPQAKMPVKSVKSHMEEASSSASELLKTEEGITKEGLRGLLETPSTLRLGLKPRKFKLNMWDSVIGETINPNVPELNIGGHRAFIDSKTGKVTFADIFKFNPKDWGKWNFLGGVNSEAGILDKLGKPFITVSENNLSPEALEYLTEKYK